MAKHKVGYTKGLNKDLSKDKYSNQNYFDANNIRIITSDGLSTGSIENEKGNKLLFSFPTVGKRIKVNINFGVSTGSVTINATTVSYDITQDNESFYNELIGTAAIATLISNGDIYVFLNDTGVYIQLLNSATTASFTNTIGTAGSTYSAATSAIYICGWTRLNEWLIVFTSDSEVSEPTSALCQIWKFKFTDGSRLLIENASVAGVLDCTEHLIYNDYLNYSTVTYIRDTVANYETSNKGRIYFTDYFNQIRVINVFDQNLMSSKVTDLDLISEVTFSKPIIQTIDNLGAVPCGAVVQYFYKQLDSDGRETIFSPGSQIMSLQDKLSNDTSIEYDLLVGTAPNTVTNKVITIEINGLDTDYDVIEYYVVIWYEKNVPNIYKIGEEVVSSSSVTFEHSSMENAISIPYASFMEIGVPFTAKTIEDRDKALVAGNIKEVSFDLDFDARAYRFNTDATPNFYLFNSDGTFENYTAATMSAIAEDHDCINPTNDDTNTDYNYEELTARQIYQSAGKTIGGEGHNISYNFYVNSRTASTGSAQLNTTSTNYTSGYNEATQRAGVITSNLGELDSEGNSVLYNIENELNNTKSVKLNAIATGYARGEVYRFGIVFFSKQGQRSFVKWIGDIKFPDPTLSDIYKTQGSSNDTVNTYGSDDGDVQSYDLGINFDIDVTSVSSLVSGFKIVRVERSQADKTRLGTGVVTNFVDYSDGDTNANSQNGITLLRRYVVDQAWASSTDRAISGIMRLFGTDYGDDVAVPGDRNLVLNDTPDILGNNGNPTSAPADFGKALLNYTSPESDFRSYTGFSPNNNVDFIRDYGYFTCYEQVYNDNTINLAADAEDIKEANLGFLYRAKSFRSLTTEGQTAQNYLITGNRYLINGEVIGNYGSGLANSEDNTLLGTEFDYASTGVQGILNCSYSFYGVANHNKQPFSLGTRKQFLRLDTSPTATFATSASNLNIKTLEVADILNADPTVIAASNNYQGLKRYFKEVAYCRVILNQYGGNNYVARSKNNYIDTGHYQVVTPETGYTFTNQIVYGGDTYVCSYSREYLHQYWAQDSQSAYLPPLGTDKTKISIAFIFCAETSVNISYRIGDYFGNVSTNTVNYPFHGSVNSTKASGDLSYDETFSLYPLYQQQNNVRTDYIAKDFLLNTVNKFPNRIKVSNLKIDGELTDNWRQFPVNQFTDVDGSLGEIHKLIAFKNNLLFFQDRGIGNLPINERAVINDVTGAALILGNGDLVGRWQYITETSGTKHQHSVVASDKTIYYYDSLQAKMYTVGSQSISEAMGLSSYFHNDLLEILRVSDDLYKANPIGVHGVYDKKNERVFFTFLGGNTIKSDTDGYYDVLDIVLKDGVYYRCIIQGNYTSSEIIDSIYFEEIVSYKKGVTISFNEKLSNFESFYDFKPGNYLQYDDKLISIDHTNRNAGYIHEENDFGKFYENYYPSDIVLVVMPNPNIISIFNAIEYYSEITIDRENVVGETMNSIQLWNNHQNSGVVTLVVSTIARQRIQTWRHKFKRDLLGASGDFKPRMRNYYALLKIRFDNNDNKRLILSDIVISYTPTKM